ncbi:hypothetical protein C8J57DRAFT_1088237, partial [Mycena rebaudengoi]
TSSIAELQTALDFIEALKRASLDNGDLDDETLHRLGDPPTEPLDISDPAMRFCLDIFHATTHGSVEMYNKICAAYTVPLRPDIQALKRRHPNEVILSHATIKKRVAEWSGVVPIRQPSRCRSTNIITALRTRIPPQSCVSS